MFVSNPNPVPYSTCVILLCNMYKMSARDCGLPEEKTPTGTVKVSVEFELVWNDEWPIKTQQKFMQ